jgi:hypothetical protein
LDLDDVRVIVNMLNKRYLEKSRQLAGDQTSDTVAKEDETGETSTEKNSIAPPGATEKATGEVLQVNAGGADVDQSPVAQDGAEANGEVATGHERTATEETTTAVVVGKGGPPYSLYVPPASSSFVMRHPA